MRILHVITPSRISGAELLVLHIARAQMEAGHTVRVVVKPHPAFVERARYAGVETHVAPISGKLNLRAAAAISREIDDLGAEVVCAHLSSATLWSARAAHRSGVPCVAMVHGFTSARWYRHADILACVSQAVADDMAAQGIPRDRLRVSLNGIDTASYDRPAPANLGLPASHPIVGTAAHLSPKKGFDELVRVAELLPAAQFVVAGEGPMRSELEEASRAQLGGRLTLLGFRDDMPAVMAAIDVFCLPSRREPFGLVLLEAMAAGKPTVAFRAGGAPEVVDDGVTGFLVPPGDCAAMADALRLLLADPDLRSKMGAAGRARVISSFTLDRTVSRLNAILTDAVAAGRTR